MNHQDNSEEEINKEIQEGFIKQIADKIVQGMENLENATDDVKRRWIWELLQNSKDVPNKFGGVTVIIEIFKDKLLFKHNGDCFTFRNITSLIQQVSSKDDKGDDPNVTGKFGTGFITTHLLSKKFIVYGVVKSQANYYKKFKMDIDRDASNSADMMIKIKNVLDELRNLKSKDSIENYDENRKEDDMDTIFEYPLNSDSYLTAKIGIDDLINYLPYSLLFNPLIKKVTVYNHKNENQYSKYCVQKENNVKRKGIELITINSESTSYKNKVETSSILNSASFIMNSIDDVNIVCPIQNINDHITFLQISPNMPKLFCSFPLIGSEEFYQPMVINSNQFSPNEARSTIFLKNTSSEKVVKNRELLVKANKLFEELIQYSINNKFDNYFNLFTPQPSSNQYINHSWVLDTLFNPRLNFLYSQPIIKTYKGTRDAIKSLLFPIADSKKLRLKFWKLNCKYFNGNVIIEEQLEDWFPILSKTEYAISIKKFSQIISNEKSIDNLNFTTSFEEKIGFIIKLIDLIVESKNTNIFHIYAILPNINNNFHLLNELNSDKCQPIPQVIKEIYQLLTNKSLDDILAHHSLTSNLAFLTYYIDNAINDINKKLNKCKDLKLKQKVALLIESLIPIQNVDSKRKMLISMLKDFGYKIVEKKINNLPSQTWKFSDQIVLEMILNDLTKISNSNNEKHVLILGKKINKNTNETLEWLHNYFIMMNENKLTQYKECKIIPTQALTFGKLSELYLDDNIPESIKEILSDQIYSQLIDKRIKCYQSHQKKKIVDMSKDIMNKISNHDKNPSEIYPYAIKLICLQNKKNEESNAIFDLFSKINFSKLIPGINSILMKPRIESSEVLNGMKQCIDIAVEFLVKLIIDFIDAKNGINDISNIFIDESNKIDWYVKFIKLLYKLRTLYYEVQNKKIFLNQNGNFIKKMSAAIDLSHDENLFEIMRNEIINMDLKDQFVIKEIEEIVKNDNFREINSNFISNEIDTIIKEFNGNKKCSSFANLIKKMKELFSKNTGYREMFSYTYPNIQEIAISTFNQDVINSFTNIVYSQNSELILSIDRMETNLQSQLSTFIQNPNFAQVLRNINSLNHDDYQLFMQNLQSMNNNSRSNVQRPTVRQTANDNNNNNRVNIRFRNNNNIHRFTNFAQQTVDEPYNVRIASKIKKMLKNHFKRISENEKKISSFYCNRDDNDDDDDFLIVLKILDSNKSIELFSYDIEFANDFPDYFVIIVVPSESNFNDSNLSEMIKIIPKIGFDLEKLGIVDVYGQLFSINDDEFEFKIKGNYVLSVKEKYIDDHSLSLNEWADELKKI